MADAMRTFQPISEIAQSITWVAVASASTIWF